MDCARFILEHPDALADETIWSFSKARGAKWVQLLREGKGSVGEFKIIFFCGSTPSYILNFCYSSALNQLST